MFANLLAAAIGKTWYLPFEKDLILWLQSLGGKGSFLYYLMNGISAMGETYVIAAVIIFLYWGIDKAVGEKVAFTMFSATLLTPMIKNVVCRTRPFDSIEEVNNFRNVGGYSFPSGHSSTSASTYGSVAWNYRSKKHIWLSVVGIALPLLVALSRMYLGAHFFTDVAVGLALGAACVFLIDLLYKIAPSKFYIYFGAVIIGIAGCFYCKTDDFFTGFGALVGFACGTLLEEKKIKFSQTTCWWRILLRIACGAGLILGLYVGLKALTTAINPNDIVWLSRALRTVRYATVVFLGIGVYPMLFAPAEKLWKKWGWIKDKKETQVATDENSDCIENQE